MKFILATLSRNYNILNFQLILQKVNVKPKMAYSIFYLVRMVENNNIENCTLNNHDRSCPSVMT